MTASLRADSRVRSVAQRIGRAELSEDTWGTHYTEFEVSLVPLEGEAAETVEQDLREILAGFPGVNFAIRGFLSERIEETLTGSTAEIVVRVFGDDLDSLDLAARRVAETMASITGTADVQYDPPAVTPEVTVRLRPQDVALAGLRPDEVLAAVEAATRGVTVAHLFEGNRATDVVVTLLPERRSRPEDLRLLPIVSDAGRLVELEQVADVARTTGRSLIMHVGTRRVQTVTANVSGGDTEGVTGAIEARLGNLGLPAGVYAEVGGSGTAHREARRELLLNSLLAGAGIVMLLWLAFGEASRLATGARQPAVCPGGRRDRRLRERGRAVPRIAGRLRHALRDRHPQRGHAGLALRSLWSRGKGSPGAPTLVARGAIERLGPILMTALVTGLGLLPLAIGSGDPGREIEGPMAVVILGGLATSTLLTLFVLPTLALRFGRFAEPGPDAEEAFS